MAKCFRKKNYNVVISDLDKKNLDSAKDSLMDIDSKGEVLAVPYTDNPGISASLLPCPSTIYIAPSPPFKAKSKELRLCLEV